MNEMIVKVMGNQMVYDEEINALNPGGLGSNGSGSSATGKIQDNIKINNLSNQKNSN